MASAHEQWMDAHRIVGNSDIPQPEKDELQRKLNRANRLITDGEENGEPVLIHQGLEVVREVHKEMRASMQT